jgi:hypothetical protein
MILQSAAVGVCMEAFGVDLLVIELWWTSRYYADLSTEVISKVITAVPNGDTFGQKLLGRI